MKRLWYENRFNPKKKGFIYDFGNYAEYFTENMKRRKVVTKLSTAERAMEDKGYEFIGEETEEDFKRRRDGFLYEKFENGERKIAAIQQPEYKGSFEGWYQSKDKSGKIVSVGPYETKEQVERVIREQGFTPVRRDKGTSIGGEKRDVWEFVKENRDGAVHFLRLTKGRYTDGTPIYVSEFYDQGGNRLRLKFDSFEEAEGTLQRLGYRIKNWNSYPFEVEFMDKYEWVPPLTAEVRKQARGKLGTIRRYPEGEVEAYFVDEDKFIPRGEYRETDLDRRKRDVDFLIKEVYGSRNVIEFNRPVYLKENRSVKRLNNNGYVYDVTDSVLERLKREYSYETDF